MCKYKVSSVRVQVGFVPGPVIFPIKSRPPGLRMGSMLRVYWPKRGSGLRLCDGCSSVELAPRRGGGAGSARGDKHVDRSGHSSSIRSSFLSLFNPSFTCHLHTFHMQLKSFVLAALAVAQTALAFPKVSPQEFKRIVQEAASNNRPDIRDGQVALMQRRNFSAQLCNDTDNGFYYRSLAAFFEQ